MQSVLLFKLVETDSCLSQCYFCKSELQRLEWNLSPFLANIRYTSGILILTYTPEGRRKILFKEHCVIFLGE